MRVLYSISMCLFSFRVTNEMENFHTKIIKKEKRAHTLRAHTVLLSTLVSELNRAARRDSASQAGGSACHRIVAFSVEHHYDNEHSFPIIGTSRVTFPLMYTYEGNTLWQFYLLHCMARLFLENRFYKLCFREYLWFYNTSSSHNAARCAVGNKVCAESNNVYCCPLLWSACSLKICMIAFWLTEQKHNKRCNCAQLVKITNKKLKSSMK